MPSNKRLASPAIASEPVTVTTVLLVLPVNTGNPPVISARVIYLILSGSSDVSKTNIKSASSVLLSTSWSVNISASIDVAFILVSKS